MSLRRGWTVLVSVGLVACEGGDRKRGAESADAGLVGDVQPADVPAVEVKLSGSTPVVGTVRFPDPTAGLVPVEITLFQAGSQPVRLTIELSADGSTWKPARVAGAPLQLPASPTGVTSTVTWNAIKDVGFHVPRTVQLRLTPAIDGGVPGAALVVQTPVLHNLRAAARLVDRYMVDYGRLDPSVIATAKRHDLVILHPGQGDLTRADVADIQAGLDRDDPADDVMVLGYVSVGEDDRTGSLGDAAIKADARFRGDGTGPRVDPRGPDASGTSLRGIDPRGAPSPGGTGFASYYLDDNSLQLYGRADGIPDRNKFFDAYFVNAGDPAWYPVVDSMLTAQDRQAGLRETMTTDWGRGLGCDGVFLDTMDTAAPNFYTDASSPNPGKFEWTAPGFAAFVARVHDSYPDKAVLQNRGVFFFDPRRPQYQFTTAGSIELAFFESYRLNSNTFEEYDAGFYADNRFDVAPKMMAEANRNPGFRVLSLGYAEGPPAAMSAGTLLGQSTTGLASLLEDIRVTQELAGFRHYLTDASVTLVNTFVLDHSSLEDHAPPTWTSTYNDHHSSWPGSDPSPRVGIQEALPGPGSGQLLVRWDAAMDMHRVRYALYHQTSPFDFGADPSLQAATRVVLDPVAPASYREGVGPGVFANEAVVSGLTSGQSYHLLIRAFDSAPDANEERNTVVLQATAR